MRFKKSAVAENHHRTESFVAITPWQGKGNQQARRRAQ
jgi:hypothetical protein